jgi:hypothetical protein
MYLTTAFPEDGMSLAGTPFSLTCLKGSVETQVATFGFTTLAWRSHDNSSHIAQASFRVAVFTVWTTRNHVSVVSTLVYMQKRIVVVIYHSIFLIHFASA